jgi:hypothetical protein
MALLLMMMSSIEREASIAGLSTRLIYSYHSIEQKKDNQQRVKAKHTITLYTAVATE